MKRILIIEDDDVIRTELKTLFSAKGYQPVDAQPFKWNLVYNIFDRVMEEKYNETTKLMVTAIWPRRLG